MFAGFPSLMYFFLLNWDITTRLLVISAGGGMVEQPYQYRRQELSEPDWRRLPGWAGGTRGGGEAAQGQRAPSGKNARQRGDGAGGGLSEAFYADLEGDPREGATISMLIPPQMLNTIAPSVAAS